MHLVLANPTEHRLWARRLSRLKGQDQNFFTELLRVRDGSPRV